MRFCTRRLSALPGRSWKLLRDAAAVFSGQPYGGGGRNGALMRAASGLSHMVTWGPLPLNFLVLMGCGFFFVTRPISVKTPKDPLGLAAQGVPVWWTITDSNR